MSDRSPERTTLFRRLRVDVSPLRNSVPYRALLAGHVVSMIGTQMRFVAMAWHVFSLTRSSVNVGLLGLAELVPLLLVSMFAGSAADSVDRKSMMKAAQMGAVVNAGLLGAWTALGEVPLLAIYAFAAIASTLESIDRPARVAMIPGLVGPDGLAPAMALRQIVFQVGAIVGPALGGLLVAGFSLALVYLLDALSFVVALASLRWVPSGTGASPGGAWLRQVVQGVRFAMTRPVLRAIFAVDLIAMIFGMPRAVFPALASETFGVGPSAVGMLFAAPAVGALAAAALSGWVGEIERQGRAIFLAVTAWGAAITLAGLSTVSLPLMLVFLALAGAADVISAVFRSTVMQQTTPDGLRGRVAAFNSVVVAGGPRLGDVEAGLVAALLGPAGSVISGGVACLALTAVLWRRAAALAHYRRPSSAAEV